MVLYPEELSEQELKHYAPAVDAFYNKYHRRWFNTMVNSAAYKPCVINLDEFQRYPLKAPKLRFKNGSQVLDYMFNTGSFDTGARTSGISAFKPTNVGMFGNTSDQRAEENLNLEENVSPIFKMP